MFAEDNRMCLLWFTVTEYIVTHARCCERCCDARGCETYVCPNTSFSSHWCARFRQLVTCSIAWTHNADICLIPFLFYAGGASGNDRCCCRKCSHV